MFCKITENYKYGVHLSFIVEKGGKAAILHSIPLIFFLSSYLSRIRNGGKVTIIF